MSNKYFNQVINKTAKGLGNFDVVQTATKVSDEVRATMKTTDGKAIQGDIFGVVLKRK